MNRLAQSERAHNMALLRMARILEAMAIHKRLRECEGADLADALLELDGGTGVVPEEVFRVLDPPGEG